MRLSGRHPGGIVDNSKEQVLTPATAKAVLDVAGCYTGNPISVDKLGFNPIDTFDSTGSYPVTSMRVMGWRAIL